MINGNHGIDVFIRDIVCFNFDLLMECRISFLVVATWVFLGFLCLYMLRVNLSVAIVAMTAPQSHKNQSVEACPSNNEESNDTTKVDMQKFVFHDYDV